MSNHLSRRALLSGIGGLGGAAALGVAAPSASAAPAAPRAAAHAQPGPGRGVHPATAPALPASIASAPQAGVSYRFVNWHDFAGENNTTNGRAFGGGGAFTNVGGDYLAAFVDMPQGALIHDVEFYLSNAAAVTLFGITWVAGTGSYSAPYWLQQSHAANASMHAVKFAIPSSVNGPFPFGSRIGVSLLTPTDASVQINGVRFGLSNAPTSTVLLANPVRVYDSTKHGPIDGGQTRAISLASHVPAYASGAIFSLSAVNTHGHGVLRTGAAGSSLAAIGLQWSRSGDRVTTSVTSAISASRKIGLLSTAGSGLTDFLVDLTGYLI